MITQSLVGELAKIYQIDTFTVMREYLQLLFLSFLYREKKSDKIYFKGGTALRLLLGSARFSQDLDFSSPYSGKKIKLIIARVEKSIDTEVSGVTILPIHSGLATLRFRLVYKSDELKFPFIIRLDFNRAKTYEKIVVSPLVTKYPVAFFPLVSHLSEKEILAEKLSALLTRAKGRDFFDVWYLLEKGIPVDLNLVEGKMKERGQKLTRSDIVRKIRSHSQKQLELDLRQFLPASQRKIIGILKNRLLKQFKERSSNILS